MGSFISTCGIWFVVLVPLAALAGWVIGRAAASATATASQQVVDHPFFRGLNYLLNEQPDKGDRVVPAHAELDKDTFETQVALIPCSAAAAGRRAIRLHRGWRSATTQRCAEGVQALSALWRGLHAFRPADPRRNRVLRPARIDQRARRHCAT